MIETVIIIGGVVGGLITTLCYNIRRSRCHTIETPCVSCKRNLMTDKELKADKLPVNGVNGFDNILSSREDSYMTAIQCQSPLSLPPITRLKSNDNGI